MVVLIMLWFLILCFYVVCVCFCVSHVLFFIKIWLVVFICMLAFKKREKEDMGLDIWGGGRNWKEMRRKTVIRIYRMVILLSIT